MEEKGEEQTAIRFTIDEDGNITNKNTLFKSLVKGEK